MRFPSWMRCPACKIMRYKPWKSSKRGEKPTCDCNQNQPQLEQITWVLIHREGHLSDVPLHYFAHRHPRTQEERQCRFDWEEPYLKLLDTNRFGPEVRCWRCNAFGEVEEELRIPFGTTPRQPWLFLGAEASNTSESQGKEELARVAGVNNVIVHSPITKNGIVIPPESRIRKGTVVDRLYRSSQKDNK